MAHLEGHRERSAPKLESLPVSRRGWLGFPQVGGWLSLLISLGLLALWEWGVHEEFISALYFPPPSFILNTIRKQVASGTLPGHISATLTRMFWGMLIGSLSGLVLGMVMGWSRNLRAVLEPFTAALHPVPKIALLPLIMVIFGIGDLSFIVVIATGAFFPLLINTMAGVIQIHPIHFDVAKNYGAGTFRLFQRVIWPGSLPQILTGLRLALNTTLLLAVAVEMVGAQKGLGAMIWMAWVIMRVEEIYVSLLIIVLLGTTLNLLLNYTTRRLIPWQESPLA